MLTRAAVVVPAHDEQDLLPGCLTALRIAAAAQPALSIAMIVVADACTDQTAAIARAAGATVIEVAAHRVGTARAVGVAAARALGVDWIANTDADSRVPPDWWTRQLAHARAGADVVAGTVTAGAWVDWPAGLPATYELAYALGPTSHHHVHGANLAFSEHAYRRAGGFAPVPASEDVAFVAAAELAGLTVVYASDLAVLTSTRRRARLTGGFASYLADLERRL